MYGQFQLVQLNEFRFQKGYW